MILQNASQIRYIRDPSTEIELIVCSASSRSYPLHNHVSVFAVGVILQGTITLTFKETAQAYQKGQFFVVPPYVPHAIQADTSYTLLTLCFHKQTTQAYTHQAIQDSIQRLLNTANGLLTDTQIHQVWRCLRQFPTQRLPQYQPKNTPVQTQLEHRPEENLSISEMAQTAYTSKYHFIRQFKQDVGLTPHQFQIQNRIRKARHLLTQTSSITEVALTTGFCDQSHFIRQFKKFVGLTPSAYQSAYTEIASLSSTQG